MTLANCGEHRVGIAMNRFGLSAPQKSLYAKVRSIRKLICEAMLQAGLGQKSVDAPLRDVIESGMTVLLKPNLVLHYNQGNNGMECMVTHPTFILEALGEVVKAKPKKVIIGDAPIQSCKWDLLVTKEFRKHAEHIGNRFGVEIEFMDFRRTVTVRDRFKGFIGTENRDRDHYVLFDLGSDSQLEPISTPHGRFRVTNYDPKKLCQVHRPGRHQYLFCREAFEVDVILSLPKLKVHRKAGVTGAIKNLVGLNGNKEYLPHHRLGGSKMKGDCYPGRSILKRVTEFLLDRANANIGRRAYIFWSSKAYWMKARVASDREGGLEGSWYGNDTCWRMVIDLNRILLYGRADGTMAETPQRRVFSLTDAIVCGEGEGPLAPSPLVVGAVTFSQLYGAADVIHCALLRLDPKRIPIIREFFGAFRWPLASDMTSVKANFEGRNLSFEQVAEELGVNARLPSSWIGHIEWRPRRYDYCYSAR